jgi:cobalt/nickel transport system ATP-binding protein
MATGNLLSGEAASPQRILKAIELAYHYPDGTPAVNNCDFILHEGERWALIGPNGAGKTTFLHLADGLLKPSEGHLEVFGHPILTETDIRIVRKRIGFLFQNPDDQLFCASILEEVAFAPLNHGLSLEQAHHAARKALEHVGLQGFEQRIPHHLSSGEKRKLALATVLAVEPDLLLFDEPTNALDPRGRQEIIRLLDSTQGTHLIATHDYELVIRHCTQVALMNQGKVVVTGTPRQILLDQELLEAQGLVQPEWLPGWMHILSERGCTK